VTGVQTCAFTISSAEIKPVKREVEIEKIDEDFRAWITAQAESMDLYAKIQENDKQTRAENISSVKQDIIASLDEDAEDSDALAADASAIFDDLVKAEVRRLITDDKIRPDGREPAEIRPLNSHVGLQIGRASCRAR